MKLSPYKGKRVAKRRKKKKNNRALITLSALGVVCIASASITVMTWAFSGPSKDVIQDNPVSSSLEEFSESETFGVTETYEYEIETRMSVVSLAYRAADAAVPELLVLEQGQSEVSEVTPVQKDRTKLFAPDAPDLWLDAEQVRVAWLIYDRLLEEGYSPEQIAGFLGNIYRESQFRAEAENENGAYGLVQWMLGRLEALRGLSGYWTAEVQIDYMISELNGLESAANGRIVESQTIAESAYAVGKHYERPQWSDEEEAIRANYAQSFYEQMIAE